MDEHAQVVIIGAGAAGLMAAIYAARTFPHRAIYVLDGASKPGAKILVAGGGRCNVTHDVVDPDVYAGSSRNAIKKVLRRFDVPQTVAFFRDLGVELKREETGKLFPTTNSAKTVLNALLTAVDQPNVTLRYACRVTTLEKDAQGFRIGGAWGSIAADKVILATGGKSLPKSGSDGYGYTLAEALGHHLTPHIFPALVPLTLPADHFICGLSGLTVPATLEVRSATGKRHVAFTDSTLCTHFGLSGPAVLDLSRYYTDAQLSTPDQHAQVTINWLPGKSPEQVEADLSALGKGSPLKYLTRSLPERLARALCTYAGIITITSADRLSREQRKTPRAHSDSVSAADHGRSRLQLRGSYCGRHPPERNSARNDGVARCPGLFLCGEVCDVDGRIGGYNFQWAWASGYVAGVSVLGE